MAGQSFTLRHEVRGAPLIERWLAEGKVEYVCTVAAPRSMYRKLHKSGTPEQVIAWQQHDLGEFPMFTPMLVMREVIAHTAVAKSDGLNALWNGRELSLPQGARIAVGPTFMFQSGMAGILDFVEDKNLPDGRFKVTDSTEDGFKFKVDLAANLHHHLKNVETTWPERTSWCMSFPPPCPYYKRITKMTTRKKAAGSLFQT